MNVWAIDFYGLREAHRRSALGRLHERHRLHVSPLTWSPGRSARAGNNPGSSREEPPGAGSLTVAGQASRHGHGAGPGGLDANLRALHGRGMLVVEDDHECDPHLVAAVESSWRDAGLLGRPTDESLTAILTAERLSMDLVTEDIDVRMLADHWKVPTMNVSDLVSSLAA
jgi:hypothetical protein